MKDRLSNIFINFRFALILYTIAAIGISVQSYLQGTKIWAGNPYLHYNNYNIFKYSFYHLLDGVSLYQEYLTEYFDLYKYSPAFSLFFGSIAWLPDLPGLILWNLINVLVLFIAIKSLPGLTDKSKVWLLFFVFFELVGSLQNSQSNGLVVGLIILAFSKLENKKYFWATFLITFSVFIKLFGFVAFALYLFYPRKPKLILYGFFWMLFFLFIPLLVTSFSELLFQYSEWWAMLANDHNQSLGISVYGMINSWLNLNISKIYILISGVFIFLIPLIQIKKYSDFHFRLLTLASILIWVIIFNHKAESPTFVIAMSGIGIYLFYDKFTNTKLVLMLFSLVFTSLMFQDFIPKTFKNEVIIAFNLKVLPSVIVWLIIIKEMLVGKDWRIMQKLIKTKDSITR